MRGTMILGLLMMVTLNAVAATKDSGSTVLKDVQPAGTTDKNTKISNTICCLRRQQARTTPAEPSSRQR
jgi:hypothetical protein